MQKIIFALLLFLAPLLVSAHDELIIRMTANGFEPKELTVTKGDEVLFINNDDTNRWPASNFHPSHTLYPEFDSMEGVKPGESWKMKFEKAGIWRMHDHLIPHMTGTITVEDEGSKKEVVSTPSLWQRLKNFLTKLFGRGKVTFNGPPLDDHGQAHLKGQQIFEKHGFQGLRECTPEFAFGCYHGLIEVALAREDGKSYEEKILAAEAGCKSVTENGGPLSSCIHGIGHGVITYREHDLSQALSDCNVLEPTLQTYCYDGVFMELSISAAPNFYKPEDPLYPCNTENEDYAGPCARSQVSVMRSRLGLEVARIALLCAESGSEAIRLNCIEAIGFSAIHAHPQDPKGVIALCESIPNGNDQAECKAAAAGELVFQNISDWRGGATIICESMNANYKQACEARVESVRKSYNRF